MQLSWQSISLVMKRSRVRVTPSAPKIPSQEGIFCCKIDLYLQNPIIDKYNKVWYYIYAKLILNLIYQAECISKKYKDFFIYSYWLFGKNARFFSCKWISLYNFLICLLCLYIYQNQFSDLKLCIFRVYSFAMHPFLQLRQSPNIKQPLTNVSRAICFLIISLCCFFCF